MSQKCLQKKITVDSRVSAVWEKWTTHEGLKTFLGLDNKVELKPGGAYEIYFLLDNPPGLRGGEGNQVLSFLPEEMLSFTWNAPPTIPEIRNHEHRTWVVVTFKEVSPEQTEVTLRHVGWLEGEKWNETYQYFESAWDYVMNALAETCKTPAE